MHACSFGGLLARDGVSTNSPGVALLSIIIDPFPSGFVGDPGLLIEPLIHTMRLGSVDAKTLCEDMSMTVQPSAMSKWTGMSSLL